MDIQDALGNVCRYQRLRAAKQKALWKWDFVSDPRGLGPRELHLTETVWAGTRWRSVSNGFSSTLDSSQEPTCSNNVWRLPGPSYLVRPTGPLSLANHLWFKMQSLQGIHPLLIAWCFSPQSCLVMCILSSCRQVSGIVWPWTDGMVVLQRGPVQGVLVWWSSFWGFPHIWCLKILEHFSLQWCPWCWPILVSRYANLE